MEALIKKLEKLEKQTIEISEFSGEENADVEKFIKNVETAVIIEGWDDNTTVKETAKVITRKAKEWFINAIQENKELPNWQVMKEMLRKEFGKMGRMWFAELQRAKPVSYTHLTLPTIYSV